MKKVLLLLLVIVLITSLLVGCKATSNPKWKEQINLAKFVLGSLKEAITAEPEDSSSVGLMSIKSLSDDDNEFKSPLGDIDAEILDYFNQYPLFKVQGDSFLPFILSYILYIDSTMTLIDAVGEGAIENSYVVELTLINVRPGSFTSFGGPKTITFHGVDAAGLVYITLSSDYSTIRARSYYNNEDDYGYEYIESVTDNGYYYRFDKANESVMAINTGTYTNIFYNGDSLTQYPESVGRIIDDYFTERSDLIKSLALGSQEENTGLTERPVKYITLDFDMTSYYSVLDSRK